MKKSNLIKVVSILLISLMVMLFATTVNAANEVDLYNELTLDNSNTANTNTNTGNTNTNTANTNTNTNVNTNRNRNTNTNNSSIYNNTALPKTGIGDVVPVAALIVVFGISAVYAYKKIKDYRDID